MRKKLPPWLVKRLSAHDVIRCTGEKVQEHALHTVCQEAHCPNILECYSKKKATFLLLGKVCTRSCPFCDIAYDPAVKGVDENEPQRVLEAIQGLGLKHVVLTMVTRDDLEDGGSTHIANTITLIHKELPSVSVEVLTSDFQGNEVDIRRVVDAEPSIFNHNLETVRRLTPKIRHKATYQRSLEVLAYAKKYCPSLRTKSGIMVGLGEQEDEVRSTLQDLQEVGVSIVTIGQYLQPSSQKLPVRSFILPEQFEAYRAFGEEIGLLSVVSGPFVRSSYTQTI